MVVHPRWRAAFGHLALWLVAAGAVAYFAHNAFIGSRGVYAMRGYEAEQETLTRELESLQAERRVLEHRAELLSAQTLDPDLLEEEARARLGWLNPRDRVLVLP
jgi:cell division protein FtsB